MALPTTVVSVEVVLTEVVPAEVAPELARAAATRAREMSCGELTPTVTVREKQPPAAGREAHRVSFQRLWATRGMLKLPSASIVAARCRVEESSFPRVSTRTAVTEPRA